MKKAFLIIAVVLIAFAAKADEGMWLLKELNRESAARMKELGFTFPINKLYDENNASLKDAVVIFGGGCTGVAVSEEGLIFTNHHCGYGAIQKLSSVEHDYLKNGFAAKSKTDELPAEGLAVSFLRSMDDISDLILPHVPSVLSEVQRQQVIDSLTNAIISQYENNRFISVRIIPFYTGNKFYRVIYDVFRDVRLTLAPPSSIGKFGGDTDNWMWPRQTGDFSVFRVYADQNNNPAEYSETNVPYKPKYVVPVSLAGVKENDYAMTIGYPGTTRRYLSSGGIKMMMEENKARIEVRGLKQEKWWDAMTTNDTIRIKYASKYSGSSNYWKNSMGMNEALVRLNVLNRKMALESEMTEWINSKPENKAAYGNTLQTLNETYSSFEEKARNNVYFGESFSNGIELLQFANTILRFDASASDQEKEDFVKERLLERYKNYDANLDRKVLPVMLKIYADRVPHENLPGIYTKIFHDFDGDYEKYADWVFDNSQFVSLDKLIARLKADTRDLPTDPAMELALSVRAKAFDLSRDMVSTYELLSRGERDYMAILMKMGGNKAMYPDATFTQRLSYGTVKGYKPRDAVWYDHVSSTKGVLEKQKPGDPEFNVQPYILDLLREGDFGRYANNDGSLTTCFLSNNDITGGNSGSPVFNGKAELIGLAFDGNWEALSGDIVFEPEMQRTISVDIRYVLYTIDKIMNSPHIIDELRLR